MPLLFLFLLLFSNVAEANITASELDAADCGRSYAAIIFDAKNGDIIFEKRAEVAIYPASLTKMMTLYLVFEALEKHRINLQEKITISANVQEVGEVNKINTLHLKEGDKITVAEAIKGTAVRSFNESSMALAELLAGSEWEFAKMMNDKARALKMKGTNFRTASGLHEDGHYTTNYDLARLTFALQKKFPQYMHFLNIKEYEFRGVKYKNTNGFLFDYKGANGMKTGYTEKAGFNLIVSAKRDRTSIDAVLTGCASRQKRDDLMRQLLDFAFIQEKNNKEMKVKIEGLI